MIDTRGRKADIAAKGRFRRPRKVVRLLRNREYQRGLRLGVAAAVEHEFVPLGDDFGSIIDVGANVGQFALFASKRYPRAHLVCVEPQAQACQQLERVLAGKPNAQIKRCAASSIRGPLSLHVSREPDSSSLLSITSRYTDAFPGTEEVERTTVETCPLDELLADSDIKRPCLLKIDAQGGELEVLKGARGILEQTDAIFVECSFREFYEGQPLVDDIVAFLWHAEFRLSGIYGLVRNRRNECLQADLLFRRR